MSVSRRFEICATALHLANSRVVVIHPLGILRPGLSMPLLIATRIPSFSRFLWDSPDSAQGLLQNPQFHRAAGAGVVF